MKCNCNSVRCSVALECFCLFGMFFFGVECFVLGENCQVFQLFSVKCGGFVCCERCVKWEKHSIFECVVFVFGVVGGVFEEFSVECFSVGNQGFVKKKRVFGVV